MKNIFYYQTNIGRIGIAEEENLVTNVFFEEEGVLVNEYNLNETELLKEASSQLYEYLLGKRQIFSVPLAPIGTVFMKSVWSCLRDIPYGKTRSYKEIAEAVGNAKGSRAVGLANNRNPIPIFIPCHRVIGANGKLIGYRGGLETKLQLLELEKQYGNI